MVRFTLMVLLALLAAGAQAYDLKGVEVGKLVTLAQLRAAFGARCDFNQTCLTEIEGVWVKVNTYQDKQGRVSSLHAEFDTNFFDIIEKAARAKYGTPAASDQQEMQNGFGARYTARGIWWVDAEGAKITLLRAFQESTLSIQSAATVKANAKPKSSM